jgi:tetratricopeptide (TPR) repeat protein
VRRILLLFLLALAAAPAQAQRPGDVPGRPRLTAGADTNDARAYLVLGEQRILERPREAADAFYWAYQLNPTLSEALYGRHTALLMTNPQRLVLYWQGDRRTVRHPEVMAIDSLYFRALTMDPFLYRKFEAGLFRMYLERWARQEIDRSGGMRVSDSEIQRFVTELLLDGGPYIRAREAYARGLFPDALRLYEDALRSSRPKSAMRAERARLHAHMRNWAPALADMTQALNEMRREDQRELVYLYESKALLEHGVGMLHERMTNLPAAREAYGRALTEELSFYPAHVRLATLALTEGDTATALAEYALAAQTTSEPSVLYVYGAILAQTGRFDEAAEQFQRLTQSAPFYADPWFGLGMVRDAQGNAPAAVQAYRGFLARATRTSGRRAHADQRVQVLGAMAEGTP